MASRPPDDTWDLYLIHADGTGLRQLTHAPPGTRLWFPTWSRDGTSIIAADQRQEIAVRVDPDTGAITRRSAASRSRGR
jgi:Tol biopolymer transport system component